MLVVDDLVCLKFEYINLAKENSIRKKSVRISSSNSESLLYERRVFRSDHSRE